MIPGLRTFRLFVDVFILETSKLDALVFVSWNEDQILRAMPFLMKPCFSQDFDLGGNYQGSRLNLFRTNTDFSLLFRPGFPRRMISSQTGCFTEIIVRVRARQHSQTARREKPPQTSHFC